MFKIYNASFYDWVRIIPNMLIGPFLIETSTQVSFNNSSESILISKNLEYKY